MKNKIQTRFLIRRYALMISHCLKSMWALLVTMVFLISCQSLKKGEAPKKWDIQSLSGGQWEAKAMIKNNESGEASVVTLDIIAKKPQNMRMEVTTSLGIALASVAMKDSEIEYVLPKQKKYFHGPVSEKSIQPALKVKVDPRILSAVFFETPYPSWECQADHGMMSECKTPEGVMLKWERDDSGTSKRISILGRNFEVQVQIKKFVDKQDFNEDLWSIKAPPEFKQYKL